MEGGFKNDPKIGKIAEAYALDAVDIAKRNFRVTLDWTEASVESVEKLLAQLNASIANAKPADAQVWTFAKAFGSYAGEVYRKHHGGTWGMILLGADKFPGIQTTKGVTFWPWARVYQRLTVGPENNLWHSYQHLTASV